MSNTLEFRSVVFGFGSTHSWRLSETFKGGVVHVFIGANGIGKSTLGRLMCGLCQPTSGTILLDGVDTGGRGDDVWRRRRFWMLPQEAHWAYPATTMAASAAALGKVRGLERYQRLRGDVSRSTNVLSTSALRLHGSALLDVVADELNDSDLTVAFLDELPLVGDSSAAMRLRAVLDHRVRSGAITVVSGHLAPELGELETQIWDVASFLRGEH